MGEICPQREPTFSQSGGPGLPGQVTEVRPPGEAHRHGGHGARLLLPCGSGCDHFPSHIQAYFIPIVTQGRREVIRGELLPHGRPRPRPCLARRVSR